MHNANTPTPASTDIARLHRITGRAGKCGRPPCPPSSASPATNVRSVLLGHHVADRLPARARKQSYLTSVLALASLACTTQPHE